MDTVTDFLLLWMGIGVIARLGLPIIVAQWDTLHPKKLIPSLGIWMVIGPIVLIMLIFFTLLLGSLWLGLRDSR